MDRPPLEVADLVRAAGQAFLERSRSWIRWKHIQVLLAIVRCRTAALGGHLDQCTRCGHRAISYNSCRNRHCPKCQAGARDRWLEKRRRELLPTPYVHVVFTLPRPLAPLALQNKKVVYDLLFRTSAETLLEVARDPRHLGAEIGFFSVLHTWNQKLQLHPHVHCVVPAGGLSADHTQWIKTRYAFFLPVKVLGRVFRGKFVAALKRAFQNGQLDFHGGLQSLAQPKTFSSWLRTLFRNDWVVYSKRPFGGPLLVLQYLGRYSILSHPAICCGDQSCISLPAAAQSPIDLAALGSSVLSSHNTYRATHHTPSITYSAALADSAQRWADTIASTAALKHSGTQGVGENLYVSYTSESSVDARKLGADAVKEWYDEVKDYNYANPGFSANTGHFTQVVWKGSTQLGCGAAKGTATIKSTQYNAFYVVCQYSVPGNVQGAFQSNVQKP